MKKILLLLAFTIGANAQETRYNVTEFDVNKEQKNLIGQFIVIEKEGASTQEMYDATIEWIKINYTNPDEVIKSQINGEYIRMTGTAPVEKVTLKHYITFTFKEGKVKMKVTNVDVLAWGGTTKGMVNVDASNYFQFENLYNKKGKLRPTRNKYKNYMVKKINSLSTSLSEYIANPIDTDDDW